MENEKAHGANHGQMKNIDAMSRNTLPEHCPSVKDWTAEDVKVLLLKKMECLNVSMYNGTSPVVTKTKNAVEILHDIKSGKYQEQIEYVRAGKAISKKEYSSRKNKLPSVTFGCTVKYRGFTPTKDHPQNGPDNLLTTTNILTVDIDHIKNVFETKAKLEDDSCVLFAFVSPGGDGLKVGIIANTPQTIDSHREKFFPAVENYFQKKYGIKIDPNCKDIARLCFCSFDPELYFNPIAKTFKIEAWLPSLLPSQSSYTAPQQPVCRAEDIKYGAKVLQTACEVIRTSSPGEQHGTRLAQSHLVGGYVAGGSLDEAEAVKALEQAVTDSGAEDLPAAMRTVMDGLEHGKNEPLYPDRHDVVSAFEVVSPEAQTIEDALPDARKIIDTCLEESTTDAGAYLKEGVIEALKIIHAHDPREYELVRMKLKSANGKIRLGALDGFVKAPAAHDDDDMDDLQLALALRDDIGPDEIIGTPSGVRAWSDNGVWLEIEDRSLKQKVQRFLPGKIGEVKKSNVDSITDLLKNEIHRAYHKFNVGPSDSINCLNGELVLNGSQWVLMPHCREHYRTSQIPVAYDPTATAPLFVRFLEQVFAHDEDQVEKCLAILEMVGYSLMSHCDHERFVILIGSGANGKSVFLSALETLVGMMNVAGVQPSQFGNKFQRAHLHNKLVNIVSEIRQGEVIDDAALKAIVSGEGSSVEEKFKDPFVMHPYSTCWFGTNHLPHTRDFSDALFRRALLIEFNETFKPELGNCDQQLKKKLVAELPGILNLALNAYADALKNGFTMPSSSQKARNAWRIEADQVAQFVEDACTVTGSGREKPSALFGAYREWARGAGINKTLTQKTFSNRLYMLGFEAKKSNKSRWITGLTCESAVSF